MEYKKLKAGHGRFQPIQWFSEQRWLLMNWGNATLVKRVPEVWGKPLCRTGQVFLEYIEVFGSCSPLEPLHRANDYAWLASCLGSSQPNQQEHYSWLRFPNSPPTPFSKPYKVTPIFSFFGAGHLTKVALPFVSSHHLLCGYLRFRL